MSVPYSNFEVFMFHNRCVICILGIGYETAKYIAAHGGRVIIACRSEEKAMIVSIMR